MSHLSEQQTFDLLVQNQCIKAGSINECVIATLMEKGLPVYKKNGYYCLKYPIIPLSIKKITTLLAAKSRKKINDAQVIYNTRSTNALIREYLSTEGYSLILAEYQHSGQGRRQKTWQSPLASNIYMSLAFQLKTNRQLNFLPLITAIAVCDALNKLDIQGLTIKWPNDIYLDGNKLGGILIEGIHRSQYTQIICGIGLNINMQINNKIDQNWTSLHNHCGIFFDRNAIIAQLVNSLINAFENIADFDYKKFLLQWQSYDCLYQKHVTVSEDNGKYTAKVKGLAQDGSLLVECVENQKTFTRTLYAADVSVKPEN